MQIELNYGILNILSVLAGAALRDAQSTEQMLRVSDGVINSAGCSGDFGCCAETADLSALEILAADILTKEPELIKRFSSLAALGTKAIEEM